MSEKTFVGRGKEVETKYGTLLKLSFSESDLKKMLANLNERGWINTVVKKMKTPSETQSHYVEIDDWKPERKEPEPEEATQELVDTEDIPF